LSAISAAIAEGLPREAVFHRIVKSVQQLGFDRVRLDLLSTDGALVEPAAAWGYEGNGLGGAVPAREDADLEQLLADARPQIVSCECDEPGAGPSERGYIPVLLKGNVVGKICVDNTLSRNPLDDQRLQDVLHFAHQVALALLPNGGPEGIYPKEAPARTTLPGDAKLWAESLETLQKTTLAITSVRDRRELLQTIVTESVKLLKAKSGGLYEYRSKREDLELLAECNRPENIGEILKLGEGMAGRLIGTGRTHMVVKDYNRWKGRAKIYEGKPIFGAVLAVLLHWEEREIGVLYVDDEIGREFSEADIRLLRLFADQAAISLINTGLLEKDEQKFRRLERLAHATQEMMGDLEVIPLQARLAMIAHHAADILEAETAGVFRVHESHLVLEASFGHRSGFDPEKVPPLAIHNKKRGGLTGYIAYHRKLFNDHGKHLKKRSAVAHSETHTPSEDCYSLLAIPLLKYVGQKEELIGLLRADNKKGEDGKALSTLGFTQEDEWILTIFAKAAVVAIEGAELVARLTEESQFRERLIASSPDGIIAVDGKGRVTEFNKQAEEILDYERKEVIDQSVVPLYYDQRAPYTIGQALRDSPNDYVHYCETAVRSKTGERIPIRHASTNLFDAEGKRVGSVGYFEDLRLQKALERRESLLLRASNVLTEADGLDVGLQRLVEMMVSELGRAFCGILLMDEGSESLTLRAECLAGNPDWKSQRQQIVFAEWEGLAVMLKAGHPFVRERSDREAREVLDRLASRLGFERQIETLLVVPLKIGERVVGQLDLGNLQGEGRPGFSKEEVDLVSALAAQITILIDRFQLFEQTRSGAQQLLAFYEMSSRLIPLQEPREILRRIVDQTVAAAGASWVSILLIDRAGNALSPIQSDSRFSIDPREQLPIRPDGISRQVMNAGRAVRIENVERMREQINTGLMDESVRAAICLPLSLPGKRIGVMWVHYAAPRRFPDAEVAALQLYVNQAAIAYDSARRMEALEDLRAASTALFEADEPAKVMQQVVRGAKQVLKADTAILWFYDAQSGEFIPELSAHSGEHPVAWSELQRNGPRNSGTALAILDCDWMCVEDIQDPSQASRVGPTTHWFLDVIGGRGFQGVALKLGRERLGVLAVFYLRPRLFEDEEERENALRYANRAALALKKAKLLKQVQRAKEAADVVARVTLLEDKENVLESIAREIREALDCSVVVLYKYDQDTGELVLPPAMDGFLHPSDGAADYSLVLTMLEQRTPCIVPDVTLDERFWSRPFARAQAIKSCVAIPLKADDRKVGVMFINYRSLRRFTADEVAIMEMLANQSAVAIRNNQLFEERATKLAQQEVVAGLSRELLGAKTVQEAMNGAVERAARALSVELSNIVLPDEEGRLIFSAGFGWQRDLVGKFVIPPGRGSQTGYTIETRRPVSVEDYREAPFKVPKIVFGQSIRSGLSVPMFRGDEIIGAMLVHTRKSRRFTGDDANLLSLIANQTAIALEMVRRYEEGQRKGSYLEALYEASKAITTQFGLERRQLLDRIVQPAMRGILGVQGPRPVLGTFQLYDEEQDKLVFESVYPPDQFADLVQRIGERRPVRALQRKGQPIGITGRAVLTGRPQLVKDVRKNRDYIPYSAMTRSELAVPLLDRGKVIGVLNAESDEEGAFDGEDCNALEALAELVVVAIQNARQFEELKEVRLLADTRTTLAWMGIGNAVRRHEMAGYVGIIRNDLFALNRELKKLEITDEEIQRTLERIERMARAAAKMERSLSGRIDAQRKPILVNKDLIQSWCRRFDGRRYEPPVQLQLGCDLSDTAEVHANVFWLKRVLDILANNAVDATKGMPERTILVGSRKKGQRAEIFVSDNGTGIREEIRHKLFREPIEKPKGAKGLGMGLLVAHAVIQIYGGSMFAEDRGGGTTIVISLPLERGT
jgi:PAS domain S-box-containing protein